jgi:hypothetical protein
MSCCERSAPGSGGVTGFRADRSAAYATLRPMLTVVAFVVAAVSGFALLGRASAAPPEDIAVFCRASYPQVMLQVRCFNIEQAAAQRLSTTASAADSALFSRCLGGSQSWSAMESCLAKPSPAPAGAAGVPPPPASATDAPVPSAVEPGPQAQLDPAAAEPERPTRPISEADAERQLRAVLERMGYPTARCTKKQYGPGWASICE